MQAYQTGKGILLFALAQAELIFIFGKEKIGDGISLYLELLHRKLLEKSWSSVSEFTFVHVLVQGLNCLLYETIQPFNYL